MGDSVDLKITLSGGMKMLIKEMYTYLLTVLSPF
jgi:hypothetical protein